MKFQKFQAEIDIMPLKELLDPQGKAVEGSFNNLQLAGLSKVRIGKHISIQVEAENQQAAEAKIETACKKLLANAIMESYESVSYTHLTLPTTPYV